MLRGSGTAKSSLVFMMFLKKGAKLLNENQQKFLLLINPLSLKHKYHLKIGSEVKLF